MVTMEFIKTVQLINLQNQNKFLDIVASYDFNKDYKTVLQRYYTPMYCTDVDVDCNTGHHCVLFHSNKICLVTVAPTHPIVRGNKAISRINFEIDKNLNRMKNKVSGKRKRGGQMLNPNSILCRVECTDGTVYNIYSCVKGKLIEVNNNLIRNPQLLVTSYYTEGHVAIIFADLARIDNAKDLMISKEDYLNM